MIQSVGDLVPEISPSAWVHPMAAVIGDVVLGPDVSIWPGAVLRGDFGPIRIGARTCVQDNAVIHADGQGTHIGADCIIGHLAFIEEAVVEDVCLIGVGAHVLNGALVRTGATVAAGAVVLGNVEVPSGYRAQGVPARLVASSSPGREYVLRGVSRYREMARRYAAGGD